MEKKAKDVLVKKFEDSNPKSVLENFKKTGITDILVATVKHTSPAGTSNEQMADTLVKWVNDYRGKGFISTKGKPDGRLYGIMASKLKSNKAYQEQRVDELLSL